MGARLVLALAVAELRFKHKQMRAIIIFQKNAVLGKVKTRLAASTGNEKALEIYQFLTKHTHQELDAVVADKFLFFSDHLESPSELHGYKFYVQQGKDLGERMYNAFKTVFKLGYHSVIIVGTDCYEMRSKHVNEAFSLLDQSPYVFGPALDGGYYLLGTTRPDPSVFIGKKWSHSNVLKEAKDSVLQLDLKFTCIESLSDIDNIYDLGPLKTKFLD